jgi:hypothetical protein
MDRQGRARSCPARFPPRACAAKRVGPFHRGEFAGSDPHRGGRTSDVRESLGRSESHGRCGGGDCPKSPCTGLDSAGSCAVALTSIHRQRDTAAPRRMKRGPPLALAACRGCRTYRSCDESVELVDPATERRRDPDRSELTAVDPVARPPLVDLQYAGVIADALVADSGAHEHACGKGALPMQRWRRLRLTFASAALGSRRARSRGWDGTDDPDRGPRRSSSAGGRPARRSPSDRGGGSSAGRAGPPRPSHGWRIPADVATPAKFRGCDAEQATDAEGRSGGREAAAVCEADRARDQQR